jgi:site-specific DNA recombinase
MNNKPPSVVGYARVSTDEQAAQGVSMDAQIERILQWAEVRGFPRESVRVYRDDGLSGGRMDNRPGLARAMDAACEARGSKLAAYSLSRISRDVGDTLAIGRRLDKAGVELVSLTESFNRETASGEMQSLIVSMFSQHERKVGIERTRAAMRFKRSRGEILGRIPIGKRLPPGIGLGPDGTYPKGTILQDDPAEMATLALIRDLQVSGLGARAIARELTCRMIPTKSGGLVWNGSTIRSIFKRCSHGPESHSIIPVEPTPQDRPRVGDVRPTQPPRDPGRRSGCDQAATGPCEKPPAFPQG